MSDKKKSQFHNAEIAVQEKLGIADMVAQYSEGFVRPAMPDQHRDFFNKLITIIIGVVDKNGYPWALPLFGDPGFIQSPDDKTLDISKLPVLVEVLDLDFTANKKIGLVGIELHTRRRNRMNGHIKEVNNGSFSVSVEQSFGNCPQYIQKRRLAWSKKRVSSEQIKGLTAEPLVSDEATKLISNVDTFFIASRTKIFSDDERCGIDASHRGGKPGFVKVEGNTLYFPDFSGNRFFNTLGNIKSDGRVGLYFPDFSTGHAVFISGDATIIWDEEVADEFEGAERVISVNVQNSLHIENYLEMVGELDEMSPSLANTGTWDVKSASHKGQHPFKIVDKRRESSQITSFYLTPQNNTHSVIDYIPGQFLPVSIKGGTESTPVQRSYTLSRASNDKAYRISVKREEHGRVSCILHDELNIGDVIYAGTPSGQFTIAENEHTIVLLSGGVGITPMFAMLEGLVRNIENGEKPKKVWFIHSTQNTESMAFLSELSMMSKRYSWLNVHIAYSRDLPINENKLNSINVSKGRIDIELLKSILPFDHYDFYLCGSEPFMRSIYSGLIDTGVAKSNIFYEFFGEGSIEDEDPNQTAIAKHAQIHFAKSDITVEWTPDQGTLLELAEKNGIQAMFSCRVGNCGACSCAIKSGNVVYNKKPSYKPNNGHILLCSARPEKDTDTITLDL